MRQAGIIAAGAIYALNHHVQRLAEDHDNARILAQGLGEIRGVRVESVETNMVFFDVAALGITAARFNELLKARGIRLSIVGNTRVRAVTHLDVTRAQVKETLVILREVTKEIA